MRLHSKTLLAIWVGAAVVSPTSAPDRDAARDRPSLSNRRWLWRTLNAWPRVCLPSCAIASLGLGARAASSPNRGSRRSGRCCLCCPPSANVRTGEWCSRRRARLGATPGSVNRRTPPSWRCCSSRRSLTRHSPQSVGDASLVRRGPQGGAGQGARADRAGAGGLPATC